MNIEIIRKDSFCVIGRLGSTEEGKGFFKRLWKEANEHFSEVKDLVKKNEDGTFAGFWGAMSSPAMDFMPWTEGFTKGFYLAGPECNDDAEAPEGWTKWKIPGFVFVLLENEEGNNVQRGMQYLKENGYELVAAIDDFTDPKTGKDYTCFPVERL